MKVLKLFLFMLALVVLNTSSIFSQKLSEGLFSNNSDSICKIININTNYVVDSIVVDDKYKYTYMYNANGSIALRNYDWWSNGLGGWTGAYRETNEYNLDGRLVKKLEEGWDWNYSLWYNRNRYSYSYDSFGNKILYLREDAPGQVWQNDEREIYEYNSDNNITSLIHQWWESNIWINQKREICEYNASGSLNTEFMERWNSYENVWVKSGFQRDFLYYPNGEISSYLIQKCDSIFSVEVELHKYTYDSDENISLELVEKVPETSSCPGCPIIYLPLENYKKHSYLYNSNKNIVSHLCEEWKDSTWNTYYKETYSYNENNNITEFLSQEWKDSVWVNHLRQLFTYNSDGNLELFTAERWDENNWIASGKRILFTDSFGNLFNFSGSEIKIFYKTLTNIKENSNILEYSLAQNFPNPFNPTTTISYSLRKSGFVKLNVYDILGCKLASLVNKNELAGNYKIEFDASSLTSGIYFYRLQSGNFTETKKLILLR